jgi:exonuclease III
LLQPAPRAAFARLVEMGWTDALRELHPDEPMFTFWSYLRNRCRAMPDFVWTIYCSARRSRRD